MESLDAAPLREWRKRRVLTIRELASRAGVSPQTVQDAEAGRRVPRFENIRKLTDALGVEPAQIAEFRPAVGYGAKSE